MLLFRWVILIIIGNLVSNPLCGQQVLDQVLNPSIKSLQFHREGWALSYPVLELYSGDHLVLSFDDLTGRVRDYSYTIVHCNAFWEESPIPAEDYLDGFITNRLNDYAVSFNTLRQYVHYRLTIPNEDVSLKLSGNYVVKVFDNFDEQDPVLVKRFVVAENLVSVHGDVKRPVLSMFRDNGQEVDVEVNLGNFPVGNPHEEVNLTICQNNRWDLALYDLKPLFIRGDVLVYDYDQENMFPGGNEYRYLDIKSIRYASSEISRIEYEPPFNHVYMHPDPLRANYRYFFQEDLNGKFYVEIQEGVKNEVESDYLMVHFNLPYQAPLTNGDVHVFGAFNNWSTDSSTLMNYNFDRMAYEAVIPLKQGYYNYEYVLVHSDTRYHDAPFFEGSFYETENDYLIYFYYHDRARRYDRVIGYQIINSLRKN